jgi:hypothetical protein
VVSAPLQTLLDDERSRRAASERVTTVRRRFEWRPVVEPLARLLAELGRRIELPCRARLAGVHEFYRRGQFLHKVVDRSVLTDEPGDLGGRVDGSP